MADEVRGVSIGRLTPCGIKEKQCYGLMEIPSGRDHRTKCHGIFFWLSPSCNTHVVRWGHERDRNQTTKWELFSCSEGPGCGRRKRPCCHHFLPPSKKRPSDTLGVRRVAGMEPDLNRRPPGRILLETEAQRGSTLSILLPVGTERKEVDNTVIEM